MSTVSPLTEPEPHEAAHLTRAQRRSQQLLGAAARLMERDGSQARTA